MRILLISPRWAGHGSRKKIKVREHEVHPLTLGIIAALSDGHEVAVANEQLRAIPYEENWDLVGITCATYTAPRAYEIAAEFRSRGVPVVMGGVHPTFMPEECLRHCSAVVRGEAEPVWRALLSDAGRRDLASVYEGGCLEDLALVPTPRRDLFHAPRQSAAYLQVTRGCGGTCGFCYLQYVGWGQHRERPIGQVIEEIASIDQHFILIVDDNLFVDREYVLALLGEMAPLKKLWWTQAPTTVCHDEELLEACRLSGCFSMSIGFQTVSRESIDEAKVVQNRIDTYCEAVRNLHRHRILADGTFIFGFDGDRPSIFDDTVEAVREMALDTYTFYLLTPYPGTPYFGRLESEGRIVDYNWAHYDWDHAVIRPKMMTTEELADGVARAYRRLDGSGVGHVLRNMARHSWVLARSPRLAAFLLRQALPQPYRVDY